MAKRIGDHTWYDEDELPDWLPVKPEDEPGYPPNQNDDNPGCWETGKDGASILVAGLGLLAILGRLLLGATEPLAWDKTDKDEDEDQGEYVGCKEALSDIFGILLAFGAFALWLVYILLGSESGLIRGWLAYCYKCQARATMAMPFAEVSEALALKWAKDGGWVKAEAGWLCPRCAKKERKEDHE